MKRVVEGAEREGNQLKLINSLDRLQSSVDFIEYVLK